MKMTRKKEKNFWEMSDAERDELVKQYDKPIPFSKTRPLTKEERRQFEKMQRSPHRSIFIMKNKDGVYVRIEPDLLRRSSRYAAEHKMTLSELINRSLKGLLAIVE
jgi:hypothetical protein